MSDESQDERDRPGEMWQRCEVCETSLFAIRRNKSDMIQVRCANCDELIAQGNDPTWFQPPFWTND